MLDPESTENPAPGLPKVAVNDQSLGVASDVV
jgi:hypothetical protein